jgi:hypothetical protein
MDTPVSSVKNKKHTNTLEINFRDERMMAD